MPCIFGDNARIDLVIFVSAADQVLYEKLLALRVLDEIGIKQLESLRRHGLVVVPPDLIFGVCITNDELVFWRTACVLARFSNKGSLRGKLCFATANSLFIKPGRSKIIKDCGQFLQS